MKAKPEMPRVALIGVALLALEWLLSSAGSVLSWVLATEGEDGQSLATIVAYFVGSALWALLIYLIATGRRWALWVSISWMLLVFALVVVGIFLIPADALEPVSMADLVWGGVGILMMLGGYALLLTRPSRAWFAAWRERRKRMVAWEVAW